MIELNAGGGGGQGGMSANAVLAGMDSKLLFDWMFGTTGGVTMVHCHGPNHQIPYVTKKVLLTKEDMDKAIVRTTDPLIIAAGELQVIRNDSIVRTFPWTFSGSGQLPAPQLTHSISPNPAAGNPGFARAANTDYLLAAVYTDAAGKTTFVEQAARTNQNFTLSRVFGYMYYATHLSTGGIGLGTDWLNQGPIRTSFQWQGLSVIPTSIDGKEAGEIVLPTSGGTSDLTANSAAQSNHFANNTKPGFYATGSAGSWTANCETCFGVPLPDGNMFRTSEITVIPPNGSKMTYAGGNGESFDTVENQWYTSGVDQVLATTRPGVQMTVRGQLYWRPAGGTAWSRSLTRTTRSFPIASEYRIPNQSTYNGTGATEVNTLTVPRVNQVAVMLAVNSESLGVAHAGVNNARVVKQTLSGQKFDISAPGLPAVVSRTTNAWTDDRSRWLRLGYAPPSSIVSLKSVTTIRFTAELSESQAETYPVIVPKGDEFFSEGQRVRIDMQVPLNARATGVEWYIRSRTYGVGVEPAAGAWGRLTGNGFTNVYLNTVSAGINPPATNTTQNYPGNYNGVLDWNDPLSTTFELQEGDFVRLWNVSVDRNSGSKLTTPGGNMPSSASGGISFEYAAYGHKYSSHYMPHRLTIAFNHEILE